MLRLIVPACSVLIASAVQVLAQQTGTRLPALAVSEFVTLMKDGQEPASAFDRSMKQNFDGTERCAEKSTLNSKSLICRLRLSEHCVGWFAQGS